MKLLNKSTLYYLLWLLPVIIISGFFIYEIIYWQIRDSTDESILKEKNLLIKKFNENANQKTYSYHYGDGDVKIIKQKKEYTLKNSFSDIELYDSTDEEMIPYRQLHTSFQHQGETFQLIITRSVIESDELAEGIAKALIVLFGFMMLGFLTVNRILSRRLWKPFDESLAKLNSLSFADMKPNVFDKVSIKEFSELNAALNKMTEKMLSDYNNQKQFTENASHEMQTPLAIIKTKIDLLIQSKSVSADDMQLIQEIENSANKLSQLNKSLLLLSKIENRQFEESAEIAISILLDKISSNFEEHIKLKNLSVNKEYFSNPVKQLNPLLAEILFSNLIQNAIRYNFNGGLINISLDEKYFSICNSGTSLSGNESQLFNRFAKFNTSAESLGLGLAIVRQVCNYYDFDVSYNYNNNLHCFRVDF